ncbi:ABC transporter substrate-binding protein [Dactylosporangium sp. NPDC000244]|uniref:ABC transporter substrate-binding protein n=1 Tax=Dactylosporangium sp. NPDC000244 TaxID=3154365 RepID=UPI00331C4BE3
MGSVYLRKVASLGLASAIALTATACSPDSADSQTTGSLTTVSYAYLGAGAGLVPEVIMANNPSICEPYGVKPKMQVISQATAPGALAAGQIQALRLGGGSFLIASSKEPASTTIVGGMGPLPLSLFVAKDVKSIADLKDKTVGAPAKGSTSDVAIRELLSQNGLTVGTDVAITYAGSSSALFGQAASGAIQGFLYSPPVPEVAGANGVYQLMSTRGNATLDNLNRTVIAVQRKFLNDNPDAVKGLLACVNAAAKQIIADPAKAAEVLAKAASIKLETANGQIEAQIAAGSYNMSAFTADNATSVIRALEKFEVAKFDSYDPSTVVNTALLPAS